MSRSIVIVILALNVILCVANYLFGNHALATAAAFTAGMSVMRLMWHDKITQ